MKPNSKELYCPPEAEVLELQNEGVVCVSGTDPFNGFTELEW